MEKLKLNLDELTVESFESAEKSEERGTVQAREVFDSTLRTCWHTNCGASYCVSAPCAC
jgi:hypothetical protein